MPTMRAMIVSEPGGRLQRSAVTSMNEIFPLAQAQAAYDRMKSGKARLRVVLKVED
jgi:D-arabinose 1-dehydrogenase-like Zn-dependent alcohol dehydrogenase